MTSQPFYIPGVVFNKPANQQSSGNISDILTGITFDDKGNLLFRDTFVTNYLKKDSVSLAEIYNRVKAITYRDGKIYFKDSSLQREYSLEEIINTCSQWKRNLIAGSLWWAGRSETDHRNCANIPKTNNPIDKLPVYWSIDKYMSDATGVSICDNIKPVSFYEKTVNPETGEWKWYDIQNLELVIPPIEDNYKVAMIISKLSFTHRKSTDPIVFRLYDATLGLELARVAVSNNASDYIQSSIPLVYVGQLPMAGFTAINLAKNNPASIACSTVEDCGCIDTTCVEGEKSCITPNISFVDKKYSPNSHLIKVQFHVADFHTDFWDRYFGIEIDGLGATKSSINAMIFDSSPATKYVHRQGTVSFNNVNSFDVVFDTPLATNKYSICLSANKNVHVWYSNKKETGFTINSEITFQGYVDWTLLNIT